MALKAGRYGVTKEQLRKIDSGGGGGTTVVANPEGSATADLTKLKVGDTIYGVEGDTSACYQTTDDTESAIVDTDYIPFLDSSAASGAGAPKKSTWSNFCSKIAAKLFKYVEVENIGLSTSPTAVTFTSADITADSVIDVYTSEYGIVVYSVVASAGSAVVTFAALASGSKTISARVYYK